MRLCSAGILNYLEKKWISQQTYSRSNYLQSNKFQPVKYMHIRLITVFFFIMVIIDVLICILENIWYKHARKFKKNNCNSILLGTRTQQFERNNLNVIKTHNKMKPSLNWRRKFPLAFGLQDFTGLHQNSSDFIGIHRTSLDFIGLCRNSSDFIGLHRNSSYFTTLHRTLSDFIGLRRIPRTSPDFIGLLTDCTPEFKSGYPLVFSTIKNINNIFLTLAI
ncbi:hypothetical protein ALC56_10184 [Trachymyrmex septentrionalis]|uniref:Uncharacterized protein n=1 Tax=Trachymyrmex septentrionalis TaxID=34720 RepID=A0A195F6D5_9HYME|nr:hypothetical protein ALC56_10184 [Trachymyrmex septentrionalis]